MRWHASVRVTLRPGILDPQGKATGSGLRSLGFGEVDEVRVGKLIELSLSAPDRAQAYAQVEQMCKRLLANPVMEDYAFELTEQAEVRA